MTSGSRDRLLRILGHSALVSIAWFFVGWWLTTFSKEHAWLSSFIEITFALNTAFAIDKTRALVLKPFDSSCMGRIEKLRVDKGGLVSDEVAGDLARTANDLRCRLNYRLEHEMGWIPVLGVVVAILSVIVLLTDCPSCLIKAVPMLILPVIIFFVGVLVEFMDVIHEFKTCCARAEEDVEIARRSAIVNQIRQVTPKTTVKDDAHE